MSQKVVCDKDVGRYKVLRTLSRRTACVVCGNPGSLVIDTLQKDVEQQNTAAFDQAISEQKQTALKSHLPKSWIIVNYGIPESQRNLRDSLCQICKKGGLVKRDMGGSFYLGPTNPSLDQKVSEMINKIRSRLGEGSWVNFIVGDYDEVNAALLRDSAIDGSLGELQRVENSMEQLERVLAGDEKVYGKNDKGEKIERKPESFGPSRVREAKAALELMDQALQRFQGNEAMEKAADSVKLRIKEVRAFVGVVEKSLDNYIARVNVKKAQGAA